MEWRILDPHPLAGLKLAKVDRVGRLRFLTPDEETRLLEALTARDDEAASGARASQRLVRERGVDPWPEDGTYTDHLTPLVRVAPAHGAPVR